MDKNYIDSMLQYAKQDMKSLPHLINAELYNLVVYHSQQCIEKSLKVVLNYKEDKYFTHHDTSNLCELACRYFSFFEQYKDICIELKGAYIITHYPELSNKFFSYSKEKAFEYMQSVDAIYKYTRDIIKNNL